MKKNALLVIILLVSLVNTFGQDTRFSQYTSTPLLINPGLTGMGNGYNRANLNYRSQWTSSASSYSTSAISIDFPIYSNKMKWKKGYLGTGILFYNDQAGSGAISTSQASLALSTVVFTGEKSKISLGFLGGYIQKSMKPDAIQWDSQYNGIQYDPTLPSQENFVASSAGNVDFSAGISYKFSNSQVAMNSTGNGSNTTFQIGVAGFHLIESNLVYLQNQMATISRRFVGHIHFLKSLSESPVAIGFSALQMQQVTSKETTVGIEARYNIKGNTKYTGFLKDAYLGAQLLYRHQDAIVPVLSYKFNNWKVSASYDYNTSKLSPVTGGVGGFEISIQFNDVEGELFNQGDKHVNYQGS